MNTTIHIPADFILANARLSWDDVRYGLEKGFIDPHDVINIAIDRVSKSEESSATEIELAALLQNEMYRVSDLIGLLTANQRSQNDVESKWLYLLLAWLYERRDSFDDPLELVEQVYSDFNYPEDMSAFVRYMPASDGYRPQDHSVEENRERLMRLWHEYLLMHRPV